MNEIQKFYVDGYLKKKWEKTPAFTKFMKMLKDISDGKVKKGFKLDNWKFSAGYDLLPSAFEYDDLFVDLLFDQKIPELLSEVVGTKLVLGKVKLRISKPSDSGKSYTTSHRDTQLYKGYVKGNIPPLININFYPNFKRNTEPELNLWKGTHLRHAQHVALDKLMEWFMPKIQFKGDKNSFILFDTSAFHSVSPPAKESMRVIWSFCREFQLKDKYFDGFDKLHKTYMDRL